MDFQDELIEFNNMWDRAMVTNDAGKIAEFMSDDWVIVGTEGGIIEKNAFLNHIRSGDLTHSQMDSDVMRIRIYGETGVVMSRGTSAGKFKGEPFSLYEWSTSIFVRQLGRWTCVLTMLTPANKPA